MRAKNRSRSKSVNDAGDKASLGETVLGNGTMPSQRQRMSGGGCPATPPCCSDSDDHTDDEVKRLSSISPLHLHHHQQSNGVADDRNQRLTKSPRRTSPIAVEDFPTTPSAKVGGNCGSQNNNPARVHHVHGLTIPTCNMSPTRGNNNMVPEIIKANHHPIMPITKHQRWGSASKHPKRTQGPMRRRRRLQQQKTLIVILVALVALEQTGYSWIVTSYQRRFAKRRKNVTVGVYYYPWHGRDFHGGNFLRENLDPPQKPKLGKYDDTQEKVIGQHLLWSRRANVKLWVTSWNGPHSRPDNTTRDVILNHKGLGDMKIALIYETRGRTKQFRDYGSIVKDVEYISKHYLNHPNYYRIDGRPVIIVYLTRVLARKGRLEVFVKVLRGVASRLGHTLYLIGDDDPTTSHRSLSQLDAVTRYDIYGSIRMKRTKAMGYAEQDRVDRLYDMHAEWRDEAAARGVGFVPGVTPGYNDRCVREGNRPMSRKLDAKSDFGSLFRAMLRRALPLVDSTAGNLLMVTSWNEWHEDTQIEPVRNARITHFDRSTSHTNYTAGLEYEGYDTLYLDILRQETLRPPGVVPLLQQQHQYPRLEPQPHAHQTSPL